MIDGIFLVRKNNLVVKIPEFLYDEIKIYNGMKLQELKELLNKKATKKNILASNDLKVRDEFLKFQQKCLLEYVIDDNNNEEIIFLSSDLGEVINISDISNQTESKAQQDIIKLKIFNLITDYPRISPSYVLVLLALCGNVNITNENGDTLLHLAVKINNLSLAKELIQSGININACNQVGTTPLHIATSIGDRTLMIQLLLTNGANIHIFNEKKVSPLSIVLSEADERKIKLLRENEINNQMIATKSNSDIRYNNLYFLGDSLSDSGAFIGVAREFNIFNIFKSQEFEAPLYKDFCSNGPTYSQILANKLGIKLVPAWRFKFLKQIYEKIGNNYAVAGAQITKLPFWKLKSIFCNNFSLPKQAKPLLKHHQLTENDLVIINIGGNELINAVNISDINKSKATINNAINIQKATIINLINNNARKIIVANAPDISKTPSFLNSYNMDKAKNLSEYFNSVWLEGMKQLQTKYPQIIKLFDLNVVFNKNLDEFQKKGGITNKGSTDVNYSCILFGLNVKPEFNEDCDFYNINDYFFFDFIHPTSWVHEQLGDIIYDLSQSKW